MLWISDWDNGIYRMDPFHKEIPQYDIGNIVISLLQDDSGKLWLGTVGNGLFVYDAARNNRTKFEYEISSQIGFNGNRVRSIIEDRSRNIWIGTNKGISRYNIQSQKFVHYSTK